MNKLTARCIEEFEEFLFNSLPDGEKELERAIKEFFGFSDVTPGTQLYIPPPAEDLFIDFCLFDFHLKNGRKVVEQFYLEKMDKLPKEKREIVESIQMNKYGFFQILDYKAGEWIKLKNMQSGKEYTILENKGSLSAEKGAGLICRIGMVKEHFRMVGSNPVMIPKQYVKDMKKDLLDKKRNITPADTYNLLLKN